LLALGVELESRDLDKQPLSEKELDDLIGGRDYRAFLNPRNELYRERKMGEKVPTKADAIRLMSKNPNLIKRPVVVRGAQIVVGLDEVAYRRLLQ
jgi:arsenate reductase-like glutaredoxin family protein